MDQRKWFQPADGVTVLDPTTHAAVPVKGKWVSAYDEYYCRRELDGDGQLFDAPPEGVTEDD